MSASGGFHCTEGTLSPYWRRISINMWNIPNELLISSQHTDHSPHPRCTAHTLYRVKTIHITCLCTKFEVIWTNKNRVMGQGS